MKILILSCSTGEGHNSAAAALQEEFLRQGDSCEIADALSFLSPRFSRLLCGAHTLAYRKMPRAFSVGYRMEEKHTSRRLFERVFRDTEALRDFLRQGEYDAVISVHVFAALMMTKLRHSGVKIPLFFVATDYTCSPGVGGLDMDAWLIPHEDLRTEFAVSGVPEEKLIPTGIPVRRCFYERLERADARRRLDLPNEGQMVLLCCGSMGCGPMAELAENLSQILPADAFLTVVCGTNETLREELRQRDLPRTRVLGFTEEMPLYLDAADLYLTKAGGLSTTEALAKGVPLLYVDAVGGCEMRNRIFMLERGYAFGAEKNGDLPALAGELLMKPVRMREMIDGMENDFTDIAVEKIANFIKCFSQR